MSTSNNTTGSGIGFCGLLAIVFIILKLTHYIDWSWWWVLCPIWAIPALIIIVWLLIKAALPLLMLYNKKFHKREYDEFMKKFDREKHERKSGFAERLQAMKQEQERITK